MRVGVIGMLKPDDFAENLAETLDQMGIDNIRLGPPVSTQPTRLRRHALDLANQASPLLLQRYQDKLVKRGLEFGCDIFICVDSRITPATVAALRADGGRVALWFPDAVSNLGGLAMFASEFDALYFKDPLLCERMSKVYGQPTRYLPQACNPAWLRPTGTPGSQPFVAVVGNLYPTRMRLLDRLMAEGVPLHLYGGRVPRSAQHLPSASLPVNAGVYRADKARVFTEARLVLNNLHPAEMDSMNLRLFEATASGGVVAVEDRDCLGPLFDRGTEVLAYSDFDELMSHITAAMAEPESFAGLREAASGRAHRDHSYEKRVAQIFEDLA